MKILLLEDSPEYAEKAKRALDKLVVEGHVTYIHCGDIPEAKAAIEKNGPYDVLILDHDLPSGTSARMINDFMWNNPDKFGEPFIVAISAGFTHNQALVQYGAQAVVIKAEPKFGEKIEELIRKHIEEDNRHDEENFIRALTLVYERRRCSLDILKAHFGSTVSAESLLARLMNGAYISRPSGEIKWVINFDKIEKRLKE